MLVGGTYRLPAAFLRPTMSRWSTCGSLCCKLFNFASLLFILVTVVLVMRFNAVYPRPHQSQAAAGHNQPCGLKIPERHEGNSSAQYLFNNRWVWVDLEANPT